MTNYYFKIKNSIYRIIIKAESQEKADEIYKENFK